MSEIIALKKQRAVNKGKLTHILNALKKSPSEMSLEDCRARLNRTERLMEQFTAIENKMFEVDPTQEPDMDYEDNYYRAISGLNALIRELGINTVSIKASLDSSMNATQIGADVRLPKLNIPSFAGDYMEWQSFHDLYVASIHDLTSITPVQKFQYLKGLLRGEAASLIRHFSITDSNYIEAFQKLRQRYDRKRHTINAFIKTFLDQPSISAANSTNIKKLLDVSDEVLRGLKAIGEHGESRDPWLIYLLVTKLDDESKNLYAQHTADNDFPTIQNLFDFLLRRSDALESLRISTKRNSAVKQSTLTNHVVTNKTSCQLCQTMDHLIYQCPSFNEMEVLKRREWIKTNSRCFNCLGDRHAVFRCLSRHRCSICKRKHHTLLHSLPTAVIKVMCSSGKFLYCRALLDSGSQASFITESCIQRLGVTRENARIMVRGLGHVSAGTTNGMTSIQIQPQTGPALKITVFILNRIVSTLPSYNNHIIKQNNWKDLQLADPHFYKPNDVDILIGVDQFFNIITDGQIKRGYNSPVLQNIIFGWVVAGTINNYKVDKDDVINGFTTSLSEYNIDATLKRFWEIESIPGDTKILSPEEELCERSFRENGIRKPDGRFEVKLPFKKPPTSLGR